MTHDSMHGEWPVGHMTDDLPLYVLRELSAVEELRIREHVVACASCAADLREWEAVAGLERAALRTVPTPPRGLMDGVWAALASESLAPEPAPVVEERRARVRHTSLAPGGMHVMAVLLAQCRLLPRVMWSASAMGILLAVLFAATLPRGTGEANVLAFALPLVAAAGMAFLYGPETDMSLELALSTPTSARTVLLSRFALLFSFDALLAVAGTVALALWHGENLAALVAVWLGPMTLLAALSLLVSLVLGPGTALGGAAALWLSRLIHLSDGVSLHLIPSALPPTTPAVLLLAAGCVAGAVLYVPRLERLRQWQD
jgi:hypothetical protein